MQQEKRKIQVEPNIGVSSVWAIPYGYRGADGSAVILAHGAGNDMEHPFIGHFQLDMCRRYGTDDSETIEENVR